MTRPTVTLLEGRHITAQDKRNILSGIAYLLAEINKTGEYGLFGWLAVPKSPKSYQITKEPAHGVYTVKIRTNETTDYGQPTQSTQTVIIQARGIAHLPSLADYMEEIEARVVSQFENGRY